MKAKFNSLLEFFFNIRIVKSASVDSRRPPQNIIVEFVGPAGVGKTTLCNSFIESNGGRKSFITREDLVPYVKYHSFKLQEIYDVLLADKMEKTLNLPYSAIQKAKLIGYYLRVLTISQVINTHFFKKKIVQEEGLFHIFSWQIEKYIDDNRLKSLFNSTHLIHCTASPEFICKNIAKRSESGKTVTHHQTLNDKELHQFVIKNINDYKRVMKRLREHGVKILEINTENSLDENSKLISSFIGKISNK